jgi:hypothetical protein
MKVSNAFCFGAARGVCVASVVLAVTLLGVICALATPGMRPDAQNRLKQIQLAFQIYENTRKELPPRITKDEAGNRFHSWRTLILPFIEEQAIYERCELREPWNSPRNCFLANEEVPLFHCLLDKSGDSKDTSFVAIGGAGTVWNRQGRKNRRTIPNPAKMILLIEIKNSQIRWAEPRDIDLDNLPSGVTQQNLLDWIANHERGVWAMFADGHLEFINTEMPWQDFMAMLVVPDTKK